MTSVARWVEVHRLAVAGREAGIARDVGGRVGGVWLARSRFADVARLAELTLTLGEDARAFYQLGWARHATGDRPRRWPPTIRHCACTGPPATAATRPPR